MPKTIKQARDEAWEAYYKANLELEIMERKVRAQRTLNKALREEAAHAEATYLANPAAVLPSFQS